MANFNQFNNNNYKTVVQSLKTFCLSGTTDFTWTGATIQNVHGNIVHNIWYARDITVTGDAAFQVGANYDYGRVDVYCRNFIINGGVTIDGADKFSNSTYTGVGYSYSTTGGGLIGNAYISGITSGSVAWQWEYFLTNYSNRENEIDSTSGASGNFVKRGEGWTADFFHTLPSSFTLTDGPGPGTQSTNNGSNGGSALRIHCINFINNGTIDLRSGGGSHSGGGGGFGLVAFGNVTEGTINVSAQGSVSGGTNGSIHILYQGTRTAGTLTYNTGIISNGSLMIRKFNEKTIR